MRASRSKTHREALSKLGHLFREIRTGHGSIPCCVTAPRQAGHFFLALESAIGLTGASRLTACSSFPCRPVSGQRMMPPAEDLIRFGLARHFVTQTGNGWLNHV